MAEIMVRAVDGTCADVTANPMRGDIVVVRPDGSAWGMGECPPEYFIVRVPGVSDETVRPFALPWTMGLQFDILSSTLPTTDSHKIKVSATRFNPTSGVGKVTRAMVETFLTNWGATGLVVADNSVTFDVTIVNAFKSIGFWRPDPMKITGLVFTQTSYNSTTGVHRMRVDYSGRLVEYTADPAKKVEFLKFLQRETTFISDTVSNSRAVVDIGRAAVRDAFIADVRGRVEGAMIRRRQYRLTEAALTEIAAAGGVMTVDAAKLAASRLDKTTI